MQREKPIDIACFSCHLFMRKREIWKERERFLRRKDDLGWGEGRTWLTLRSAQFFHSGALTSRAAPQGFLRRSFLRLVLLILYTLYRLCWWNWYVMWQQYPFPGLLWESDGWKCARICIVVVEYQSQFCWHFVSKQKKRFSSINTSTIQNIWKTNTKPGLLTYNIFSTFYFIIESSQLTMLW